MFQLIAVARFVGLVVEVKNNIGAAAIGEGAEEVAVTDIAGGEAVAPDILEEGGEDGGAVGGFAEAHDEGDGVGALGTGGVGLGGGIIKALVEGGANVLGKGGVGAGIVGFAEQCGDLGEDGGILIIISGGGEGIGGELGTAGPAGANSRASSTT